MSERSQVCKQRVRGTNQNQPTTGGGGDWDLRESLSSSFRTAPVTPPSLIFMAAVKSSYEPRGGLVANHK